MDVASRKKINKLHRRSAWKDRLRKRMAALPPVAPDERFYKCPTCGTLHLTAPPEKDDK